MSGKVLGEMEPGELQAINSLRQREQEMTYQIGRAFRDLMGMAMQAGEANHRMQEIMVGVRQRMDIPEDKTIQVTTDGKVVLVETPGVAMAASEQEEAPPEE